MAEASRPDYGVILARDVEMRARDGVRLATDVWRPALGGEALSGPFPLVMVRTPYNRTMDRYQREGEFWASRGYIFVIQDVRGRFGSEGDFVLLANEGPDGYDAVEWAAALPFSDGQVGTYGTSYSGWVQSALALERPPHLRAMWINQGGSNGNATALRHNGALELRWLTWAVSHGAVSPEAARDPVLQRRLHQNSVDMYEWLRRLPWTEGNTPLEGLPGYAQWARDLYEHGDDDDFWRQRGLNFEPYDEDTADIPTMYSGGWYDSYTKATTDRYVSLKGRLEHQRLLMGSWTHGDAALDHSWAGEVELGPDAPIGAGIGGNRRDVLLRWFDHWLRGVDNGVGEESAVRTFVLGGGSGERTPEGRLRHGGAWRDLSDWPPPEARPHPMYFGPGGALSAEAPEADGGASTYRFDPADPLPTISANTSSLNEVVPTPPRVTVATPISLVRVMVVQGGADQRTRPDLHGGREPYGPLEDRPDVLAFTSEPLAEDLEVVGPVEAVLYVESDAPDTDFFVMLQDIYPPSEAWPDGYRLNVTDGIMRARYREGMDCPCPLTQGEVAELRFSLYPTANRFVAGHRIQVLVSSSSFPRFDVNPNTGEPIGRHTRTQVATNTLHHSREHPSRVVLSVLPRG